MSNNQDLTDAVAWAVRTADPEFDDWMAFEVWLEGDVTRNSLYDYVVAEVAAAAAVLSDRPDANPTDAPPAATRFVPRRRARVRAAGEGTTRRMLFVGGGAAAAAAAAVAVLLAPPSRLELPSTVIEVPSGERRTVALVDGSRIELAGGSRLQLDPATPRLALLARGRAMFFVRHDATAPFHVRAGRFTLQDAGTAFEVARLPDEVRIVVAEGRVVVEPEGHPLTLDPGEAAVLSEGTGKRTVSRVDAGSVAQWRNARMSYRDERLAQVVADLSAATGHHIDIAAGLESRRFTGTLIPATLRGRPDELAMLIGGIVVHVRPDGWELRPQ